MKPEEVIQVCDSLKSDRSNWESLWEECADYVLPNFDNILSYTHTKGEEKTVRLFDSTAVRANEKMAAGLYSYLCPPTRRWFSLMATPDELNDDDDVVWWLDKVTDILHEELNRSNFAHQTFTYLLGLGAFGTACMYMEQGVGTTLNFNNNHIRQIFIQENSREEIDSVYRRYEITARQALQDFGEDTPDKVKKLAMNPSEANTPVEFIHAVYPRDDFNPSKKNAKGKRFVSQYICMLTKEQVGDEGGYDEMPYLVDRFSKAPQEVFGRGPGINCLPDIKMLNTMALTLIKASEKVVDPPLLLPDDGSVYPLRTTPRGVMYYQAGMDPSMIQPLPTSSNIGYGLDMVNLQRDIVQKGFYVDMFQALVDKRNMTATEVMGRMEEKMMLLGPAVGRSQTEFFSPLIERAVGILGRAGILPPPPEGLGSYKVEYTGKLSLSMQMVEGEALTKTMEQFMPLIQGEPAILDILDTDKAIKDTSLSNGVPASWLRKTDEVAQIREQRAQQQAQMQQMEMLEQASKAAKNVSGPVDETSIAAAAGENLG